MTINKKISNKKGFSTVEMLMALTIITLSLVASVGLIFSGQSFSVDTELNSQGIYLAQNGLEDARARGREEFNNLIDIPNDPAPAPYTKSIIVTPGADQFTKIVTSLVTWMDGSKPKQIKLSTIVTSPQKLYSGDECQPPADSNWANPKVLNSASPINLHSGNTLTSVGAKGKYVFITASGQDNATLGNGHNFYSINATDPSSPIINTSTALVGYELNAVSVSGNYAYVMGFNHIPYGKVGEEQGDVYYQNGYAYVGIKHGQSISNGQFYIIDITSPDSPSVVSGSKVNLPIDPKIPTNHQEDEFMIFNVEDIHDPKFVGGIANETIFGSKGINSIQIYNNFAVIGTENDYLVVVDITDKSNPVMSVPNGTFQTGSHVYGLSINSKGRIMAGSKGDLFMLDATPLPSNPISQVDSQNPVGGNQKISGLMGSGEYAFLGMQDATKTFSVIKIDPDGKLNVPPIFEQGFGGKGAPNGGLVCVGNLVYLGLYPTSVDALKIIGPGPGARISISPLTSNKNPGEIQTLTGHVDVNYGSGFSNAPDGTTITFTRTGTTGTITPSSCVTSGGGGSCSVSITSNAVGNSVVNAGVNITVSGTALSRNTDGLNGNSNNASILWKYNSVTTGEIHKTVGTTHVNVTVTTLTTNTTVHGSATVTGTGPTGPTGTVTFTLYTDANCTVGGSSAGSKSLTNGLAHPGSNKTLSSNGTYSMKSSYPGDTNYSPSESCVPVTLQKLTPNITTTIYSDETDLPVTTILHGKKVYTKVKITGSGATPTGKVDFFFYPNGTCTDPGTAAGSDVNLSATGEAKSSSKTATVINQDYSFKAYYQGDANYNDTWGGCTKVTTN